MVGRKTNAIIVKAAGRWTEMTPTADVYIGLCALVVCRFGILWFCTETLGSDHRPIHFEMLICSFGDMAAAENVA